MDWLNQLTAQWSLKTSYLVYQTLFFITGLVCGKGAALILESWRMAYLKNTLGKTGIGQWEAWVGPFLLSKFISYFILWASLIGSFSLLVLGFYTFYRHKISPPLEALRQLGDDELIEINNQDELALAYKHIQDELCQIEREKMIEQMEKSRMIQGVDALLHDIRNPLTVLKGNISILKIMDEEKNNPRWEIYESMARSEERIETYLNYLSKKDRLERVKPRIKEESVEEIIQGIARELTHIPLASQLMVDDLIKGAYLALDLDLFYEAFENILANAQRFARSKIEVRFLVQEEELVLQVWDDGPGFSNKALACYDQCYYTEDEEMLHSGLGLYMVKKIVDKHGMELRVYNKKGAIVEIDMGPLIYAQEG